LKDNGREGADGRVGAEKCGGGKGGKVVMMGVKGKEDGRWMVREGRIYLALPLRWLKLGYDSRSVFGLDSSFLIKVSGFMFVNDVGLWCG